MFSCSKKRGLATAGYALSSVCSGPAWKLWSDISGQAAARNDDLPRLGPPPSSSTDNVLFCRLEPVDSRANSSVRGHVPGTPAFSRRADSL